MTREEAKAKRSTTYYGSVCKKHPLFGGLRRMHGVCVGCKREKDAAYRAQNTDKVRATIDAWAERNPDKVKQYLKKSKSSNKGRVNAATAKRRKSVARQTPSWLTVDDFWMVEQAYDLAALRTKMLGFSWNVDHVIPLQGKVVSGLHTPYNLQVVPKTYNVRKANKFEII